MGDSPGAGVTGAVCEQDADVGKSSQPGNEGSHRFVTFLLDLIKEIRLLLHSGLIDLLPQVVNCDG